MIRPNNDLQKERPLGICVSNGVFCPGKIHDQRCMSWGQTLKDTRDEVYAEFPESNEWCTMQWADVFSWWFRCENCLSADDLPSSFPPWNSKSEKWEQSLWNLSKPTKRIHFLTYHFWVNFMFYPVWKSRGSGFPWHPSTFGKKWPPRRFRELGKWSTASVCSSSWLPKWRTSMVGQYFSDGGPITVVIILKKRANIMKYDEICDFVHGNICPS